MSDIDILCKIGLYGILNSSETYPLGAGLKHHGKLISIRASNSDRNIFGGVLVGATAHAEINTIYFASKLARKSMRKLLHQSQYSIKNSIPQNLKNIYPRIQGECFISDTLPGKMFNRATMYISYINIDSNNQVIFKNASPCAICTKIMLLYGITTICYTVNGGYVKVKLADYIKQTVYITGCTMKYIDQLTI